MKICAHASYQGQAYYAFTGFRIMRYETWLFRFLGSKICFMWHFGHEGGPESKIEGPKEQYSLLHILGSKFNPAKLFSFLFCNFIYYIFTIFFNHY
jgi:hypothetical protein